MDKKLYKFGMDWLNGVLPVEDVSEVFKMLEMFSGKLRYDRWQLTNSGKYNYRRRFCLDGNASIQIMYNPVSDEEAFTACKPLEMVAGVTVKGTSNNPYIFFSISGDGIRYLHSLGGEVSALNKLLFYFYRNSFRASRFDVYCDILDKDNKVVPLIEKAFSHFISPVKGHPTLRTRVQRKSENITMPQNFDENGDPYFNCVLGNHGTRFGMFRSYNKYEEVRTGRLSRLDVKGTKNKQKDFDFEMSMAKQLFNEYGVSDYWYRLEYELHKENAAVYFDSLMKNAEDDNHPLCFEDIFFSVFDRVFTVVECSNFNFSTCDTSSVWLGFRDELSASNEYFVQFGGVPYIKCSLHRLDKNMERISSYMYLVLMRLFSMDPKERQYYIMHASDKFMKNKRYNSIRDEFDELSVDSAYIANKLHYLARYAEIA